MEAWGPEYRCLGVSWEAGQPACTTSMKTRKKREKQKAANKGSTVYSNMYMSFTTLALEHSTAPARRYTPKRNQDLFVEIETMHPHIPVSEAHQSVSFEM